MHYKKLTINTKNDPELRRTFKAAVRVMRKIPALKQLILDATKGGPITVDFIPSANFLGTISQEEEIINGNRTFTRNIKIATHGRNFREIFETLIFELLNAQNPYLQLSGPLAVKPKDYHNRRRYAKATEFVEYTYTHAPSRKIFNAIANDPNMIKLFSDNGLTLTEDDLFQWRSDALSSFKKWWENAKILKPWQTCSHAEFYKRQYDQWRANHPEFVPPAKSPKLSTLGKKPATTTAPQPQTRPSQPQPVLFSRVQPLRDGQIQVNFRGQPISQGVLSQLQTMITNIYQRGGFALVQSSLGQCLADLRLNGQVSVQIQTSGPARQQPSRARQPCRMGRRG